jgi:hypothetical protein
LNFVCADLPLLSQELDQKKEENYQRLLAEFEEGRKQNTALKLELQQTKGMIFPVRLSMVLLRVSANLR